jgi:carbamoyl-phosphate synthase large subunit
MRSTGEVMASADDLPTAFAKAERAAGRPLPTAGTVFLSVRDADKLGAVAVARQLAGAGFALAATAGTARALEGAGLVVETIPKVSEGGTGANVVDRIRNGRCALVLNTPQGSGARLDGARIREAALAARSPCITTLAAARLAADAIVHGRPEVARSLQERLELELEAPVEEKDDATRAA